MKYIPKFDDETFDSPTMYDQKIVGIQSDKIGFVHSGEYYRECGNVIYIVYDEDGNSDATLVAPTV